MSFYKYVSENGTLRFLTMWELRLTPPARFNDPFECRLPITADALSSLLVSDKLCAHLWLRGEIAKRISAEKGEKISVYTTLVGDTTEKMLQNKSFRERIEEDWKRTVRVRGPEAVELLKINWRQRIYDQVGILCFTRSAQNLLMWAHYAECHRGTLIKFTGSAPVFCRPSSVADRLGYGDPVDVQYRDCAPSLLDGIPLGETAAAVFAEMDLDRRKKLEWKLQRKVAVALLATKALQWAYEQEIRLVMKLKGADRVSTDDGQAIHLLTFPPNWVESITIGCRADESFAKRIKYLLSTRSDTMHIKVFRNHIEPLSFALRSVEI